MKIYTGIGSRQTPHEILILMMKIAQILADNSWALRSGHALGADMAFETGARNKNGQKEIYLPWDGFEGAYSNKSSASSKDFYATPSVDFLMYSQAEEIAAKFHPAWECCSRGAKLLHTRNVYQVVGYMLNQPSNMVICWTKDGKRGGGTGQALRIAEYLKIPIFDLAVCTLQEIQDFINEQS